MINELNVLFSPVELICDQKGQVAFLDKVSSDGEDYRVSPSLPFRLELFLLVPSLFTLHCTSSLTKCMSVDLIIGFISHLSLFCRRGSR